MHDRAGPYVPRQGPHYYRGRAAACPPLPPWGFVQGRGQVANDTRQTSLTVAATCPAVLYPFSRLERGELARHAEGGYVERHGLLAAADAGQLQEGFGLQVRLRTEIDCSCLVYSQPARASPRLHLITVYFDCQARAVLPGPWQRPLMSRPHGLGRMPLRGAGARTALCACAGRAGFPPRFFPSHFPGHGKEQDDESHSPITCACATTLGARPGKAELQQPERLHGTYNDALR